MITLRDSSGIFFCSFLFRLASFMHLSIILSSRYAEMYHFKVMCIKTCYICVDFVVMTAGWWC